MKQLDCAAAQAWDCCLSCNGPSGNHTCQSNAKLEQQHRLTVSANVPVQSLNSSTRVYRRASKASKTTLCVQALSSMRGLQSLGVSQCSGVTGEALGQLLPSLPACTHLSLNCLHLTDDHLDILVKVLPHAAACPLVSAQLFQPATQLLVHCLSGYMLTAFGQDCACGTIDE